MRCEQQGLCWGVPGVLCPGRSNWGYRRCPRAVQGSPGAPHGSVLSPSPSEDELCATCMCWPAPAVAQGDGMAPGMGAGRCARAGQLISPVSLVRLRLHLSI